MLSVNVPVRKLKTRFWARPKPLVVAVFSFRFDAHLVPDLLANIAPFTDGWVSWDDRQATGAFSDETRRRRALIEAAHAAGAKWILAVDPDERFEVGLSSRIDAMIATPGLTCWTFWLRELYAAGLYRVDGIWGGKTQNRLFSVFDEQFPIEATGSFPGGEIHAPWVPPQYKAIDSGLNLYHLKMIVPARRKARGTLYSALDPERKQQKIGYDYLADESGLTLTPIPPDRQYLPPHREDGGLWMADPASFSDPPG